MNAPPSGQVAWEESLAHISAQSTVWVRLAAVANLTEPAGPSWDVRLLELTSGTAPPSWQQTTWAYPACVFLGWTSTGDGVAEWLKAGQVTLGETKFELPPSVVQPTIRWERHGTTVRTYFERVGWPTVEADFNGHWPNGQREPQEPLVHEDLPSFSSFYAAAAAFFWLDRQPVGGAVNPTVRYRHADHAARIANIRIASDYIDVVVEGSALEGVVLELAGDVPGEQVTLTETQNGATVRFPVPGRLPSGAWVLLKAGSTWLDRWFLNHPFRRATEVEPEWVVEPQTRIEAALASRERHNVEFKSEVPTRETSKRRAMATIAAFANGDGGSLFVGITDDREVVGVDAAGSQRSVDTLARLIRSWVHPTPPYAIEVLALGTDVDSNTDPRVLLEVIVGPGTTVYGVGTSSDGAVAYVRPFSTNERASPSEIIRIAESRAVSRGWSVEDPQMFTGGHRLL